MVLTKWTPEMTSKFIYLHHEQECLWRIDSLTYRDRDSRNTALRNMIAGIELPDLTVDDVKKKIKYLRSTYMVEVNKQEKSLRSGAGTSTIYKSSLSWFNEMDAFIKYVNVKRNTQSSSISQPDFENTESDEHSVTDTNNETDTGSVRVDQQKYNNRKQEDSQKRNTAFGKRSRLNKLSSVVENMQALAETLNSEEQENDEIDIFGKN
ncbi:unnamed protein product [Parnassius mnemosyne]|uniref:MADF domain-containing protein n=1 Tax=Parnassius mnemosyne TaxID=213953 RepID=A0AAV1LBZ3_9NEOP